MHPQPAIGFELVTPESEVFDEHPGLFVDLNAFPVVFSVRGIAYFAPRFGHVGVDISTIRTAREFEDAHRTWGEAAPDLLGPYLKEKAARGGAFNPHGALSAIWNGDEGAERLIQRLEHQHRAKLAPVR